MEDLSRFIQVLQSQCKKSQVLIILRIFPSDANSLPGGLRGFFISSLRIIGRSNDLQEGRGSRIILKLRLIGWTAFSILRLRRE